MTLAKILPLLNRLIPSGLAIKGLQKLNPNIGKFVTNATALGFGVDQILGYVRDQVEPMQVEGRPDERASERRVQQGKAPERALGSLGKAAIGGAAIGTALGQLPQVLGNMFEGNEENVPNQDMQKNPIEAYSKELHNFIVSNLNHPRQKSDPKTVAMSAFQNKIFQPIIKDIQKDFGVNFEDLVQQLYGQNQQQASQSQDIPQQQAQQSQGLDPEIAQLLQQGNAILQRIRK